MLPNQIRQVLPILSRWANQKKHAYVGTYITTSVNGFDSGEERTPSRPNAAAKRLKVRLLSSKLLLPTYFDYLPRYLDCL